MEMEQMKEQGNVYCRDWGWWWCKDRRRRSRIGIFFIIIGALWIGSKLGFINLAIFWPLAFIAMGTWIFASGQRATSGSVLRDKKSK